MGNKTPLHKEHLAMHAKLVDFFGWEMPIHYGSQLDEHHQVRRDAGMFDVSHMTVLDLHGARAQEFLRHLLANNVGRMKTPGKAIYSCMLDEQGGVLDDLIVYFVGEGRYRIVLNAATREKCLSWIERQAEGYNLIITPRQDLAMIAVQGPHARDKVHASLGTEVANHIEQLTPFNSTFVGDMFIARTGYTGEDGYEIILSALHAPALWINLHRHGVAPIGLGARDTLRLEAGMNLYGADMDESTTPLVSGLEWTVAWEPSERAFIGRAALEAQRQAGVKTRLVGLLLEDKGVLRAHQKVITDSGAEGEITSGTFSPTLGRAIALARVPSDIGLNCKVDIRGKLYNARVVHPPFVRHGKVCYTTPAVDHA